MLVKATRVQRKQPLKVEQISEIQLPLGAEKVTVQTLIVVMISASYVQNSYRTEGSPGFLMHRT